MKYYEPNVYNLGSTGIGGHLSQETKDKIKNSALRGEQNPAKRPEVRLKISQALKGKSVPTELRIRISNKLKGSKRTFTQDHIQNLRKASKNKRAIIQLTLDGQFIREWESLSDIVRATGFDQGNISSVCAGRQQTSKGFKWMYKEDYYGGYNGF